VSVALIGAGNVARTYHVPCVTAAGATVRYAVDPDPTARRLVSALVPAAATVGDLADLRTDVDCAIVCTPPNEHPAHVRWLLERGIPVLCEKPLACTEKDAEALVELARANGVVLQVGYYRRFHPSALRVRTWLHDGALGRPRRGTIVGGQVLHPRDASASLMDPVQSGGGVLIDVGVHVVDRLLSWFDAVTLRDYLDDHAGGMEANALVRLEGHVRDQRVPLTMLLSRTADLGYHVAVEFDEGTVVCALNTGHALTVIAPADGRGEAARSRTIVDTDVPRPAVAYFGDQWAEFVAQLRGEAPRVSSLRDAVRTTAIVEACYRTRRPLALPWEADA
jgi:predicted dehydrogenase